MQKDFFQNLDKMQQKKMTLTLSADAKVEKAATALGAKTRRKILALLQKNSYTVKEVGFQHFLPRKAVAGGGFRQRNA